MEYGFGSPPRAWGQLHPGKSAVGIPRFTPTGVGTMSTGRPTRTASTVHPHGRGDNVAMSVVSADPPGSPPRAWGQCSSATGRELRRRFTPTGVGTIRAKPVDRPQVERFTPTGVGTMSPSPSPSPSPTVHPHGRGDNEYYTFDGETLYGSPPRAWGQSVDLVCVGTTIRFTPTGVGTIGISPRGCTGRTVHPHGRGDNRRLSVHGNRPRGSPPRAWGQLRTITTHDHFARFTPTGVGTMLGCSLWPLASPVHPHGRGDNSVLRSGAWLRGGSPPRAWGQSATRCSYNVAQRFTPTGVGTMRIRPAPNGSNAVHPHGRGDNRFGAAGWRGGTGSPPRAWGQSEQVHVTDVVRRFTPTGVGTITYFGMISEEDAVHPHGRGDNDVRDVIKMLKHGSPPRAWGQ